MLCQLKLLHQPFNFGGNGSDIFAQNVVFMLCNCYHFRLFFHVMIIPSNPYKLNVFRHFFCDDFLFVQEYQTINSAFVTSMDLPNYSPSHMNVLCIFIFLATLNTEDFHANVVISPIFICSYLLTSPLFRQRLVSHTMYAYI